MVTTFGLYTVDLLWILDSLALTSAFFFFKPRRGDSWALDKKYFQSNLQDMCLEQCFPNHLRQSTFFPLPQQLWTSYSGSWLVSVTMGAERKQKSISLRVSENQFENPWMLPNLICYWGFVSIYFLCNKTQSGPWVLRKQQQESRDTCFSHVALVMD